MGLRCSCYAHVCLCRTRAAPRSSPQAHQVASSTYSAFEFLRQKCILDGTRSRRPRLHSILQICLPDIFVLNVKLANVRKCSHTRPNVIDQRQILIFLYCTFDIPVDKYTCCSVNIDTVGYPSQIIQSHHGHMDVFQQATTVYL